MHWANTGVKSCHTSTTVDHGRRPTDGRGGTAYGRLIIAASLSTVAATALPGLAGLIIPTLAGMRIGYRQAKAGRPIRTSGIARFSGSGPTGVVRSGSVMALRRTASLLDRLDTQSERVA